LEKRSNSKYSPQNSYKKNDRKINVKPNLEFIEIKEKILLRFFECIRENGKIDNPS